MDAVKGVLAVEYSHLYTYLSLLSCAFLLFPPISRTSKCLVRIYEELGRVSEVATSNRGRKWAKRLLARVKLSLKRLQPAFYGGRSLTVYQATCELRLPISIDMTF